MRFEHRASVPAGRGAVWDLLIDVPRVARCVPGLAPVEPAGADRYRGTLAVQVGPVRLALRGEVAISERDAARGTATMRLVAEDRPAGGGVHAVMRMTLADAPGGATELRMESEVRLLGRIGDVGQPIIRRKADQLMAQFAENLARTLAEERPA